MNSSFEHISFAKLTDLAEHRLKADERTECFAHIRVCLKCATDLSRLQNTIDLMRTDYGEDAPRDVIRRSVEMFRSHFTSNKQFLPLITAVLSFDSRSASPAYGLRSVAHATYQLIYSAGDYDLDLRLTPQEDEWILAGQVLGKNCVGAKVDLEGMAGSSSTTLNELCEFTLPPVPNGDYRLRLRLTEMNVEVSELRLRA